VLATVNKLSESNCHCSGWLHSAGGRGHLLKAQI